MLFRFGGEFGRQLKFVRFGFSQSELGKDQDTPTRKRKIMKNIRKVMLPLIAVTALGLTALVTPAGATAVSASIIPSNSAVVAPAAFPLTGIKKIVTVVTKVAQVVTLVTKLLGNAAAPDAVTPQLSADALN